MVKTIVVTIRIIGPGTPDKQEELTKKILEAIKLAGERSLGDLQASVEIKEK